MTDNIIKKDRQHVWHPFTQEKTAPLPIAIESAKGVELYTYDGKVIYDMISSWWVNLHGHANPLIANAIAKQAHKLEQVIFAGFTHKPAVDIATKVIEILPKKLNKVFFSDDGSTAIEVALKTVFQYHKNLGNNQRNRLLSFKGGYHGDTFGAMCAGVGSGFWNAFKEQLFPIDTIEYSNWHLLEEDSAKANEKILKQLDDYLADNHNNLAGLIIEPLVQGAAGMNMMQPELLDKIVARVQQAGGLVIFDEVMTGFGRTGKLFAMDHINEVPDLVCFSKGLTGGFLPMSMTVMSDEVYQAFLDDDFNKSLIHGHSFTANPLGCAAALASLELTLSKECLQSRAMINEIHNIRIMEIAKKHSIVIQPRVLGTIAGININVNDNGYNSSVAPVLKQYFIDNGWLIRPLGNCIYLMPPYCIDSSILEQAWDCIDNAIDHIN